MSELTKSKTWEKLAHHKKHIETLRMRDVFKADPNRAGALSVRFGDLLLDYSKNLATSETMDLLFELANFAGLKQAIESMFSGERINFTENRAVLHAALRDNTGKPFKLGGVDVSKNVAAVKAQMKRFVDSVHNGDWKGLTGKTITDVVNIGIGGSDLGPAMVCEALTPYHIEGIRAHFVSNVDPTHLAETLKKLDPERTLFIIASKSFSTQETLANAQAAKKWFLEKAAKTQSDIAKHFVALSTNEKAVSEFGINTANMFAFWDWVGGRYSLWSAIGTSIALQIGWKRFEELLDGACETDVHFRESPFEKNIPVILGMLGVWYADFFDARTYAVIPYDQYLARFPEYLQQLDMESNGKRIRRDGEIADYRTGPVVWGAAGTNAQHSFFQLIHQGTQLVPADFLAAANSHNPLGAQHEILLSNFFAQTAALMKGKTDEEARVELKNAGKSPEEIDKLAPHKVFPGNKPTNSIMYDLLTPKTLGKIIAIYEHKVFVQGVVWNINSFDQWGVELGKQLAKRILPELAKDGAVASRDSSTNALINYYKQRRKP